VRSSRYTNSPTPLSRKRGRRPGFALIVLAFLLPLAALAASQITWKEQFYNPHPLPEDLILPMPCGGAMVFRPVVVPADRLLGDRRITLGGQDERFAFAEGFRQDFLAGSFAAPGAAAGAQAGGSTTSANTRSRRTNMPPLVHRGARALASRRPTSAACPRPR
jgi:hypothetical protein